MNAPYEFEASQTSWRSVVLSVLFHGLLLATFVFLWRSEVAIPAGDSLRSVDLVLADVSNDGSAEYLEQLPAPNESANANATDVRDLLPIAEPAPNIPSLTTPQAIASPGTPNLDAGAMTQPTGNSGLAVGGGGEFTAEELKQIAEERQRIESLLPKGNPATIHVFGSGGLTGRKFVFLIDRSKSMGDQGLGVLARANGELQTALAQLTSDHEFQVVAYHHETTTIGPRALLPASAENREKVAEFVETLAAFGGTEHESGLIAALALRPDIVVMLTDGGLPEMNEGQLATVRRIAGKKVQIHCIQFGLGPGPSETFMISLAQQNNGSYKYIDVSKWK